ncbi:FecR family protein [Peristeroidobacter soli]|jgi:transmembrane sensor|uniref:FecR family protein n=1 Tax=Peristeroidobacter soli TaxID=2497877 RepID=UPI00101D59C8|nr:FecR domain-containing protein [Peristeroidobacter soli]
MSRDSSRRELSAGILEEASSWVIELSEADLDAQQRGQLDRWLRRSPEHVQAFLEISAAWEESSRLEAPRGGELDALIARVIAENNVVPLATSKPTTSVRREPRSRVRRLAIAASVVLAVGTLAWWARPESYSTRIGEQRSIALADGSVVQLNSQSQLRVRFSKNQRLVELSRGQALFEVFKDASRPFIVVSDGASVKAVGTQFDVNHHKQGIVVTVVEGRVAVTQPSAAQPMYLVAGDKVTLGSNVAPRTERANVDNAVAWTHRRLIFDDTPLTEVIEEFNRYNVRRFVINDASLEGFHIRGTFDANKPERLVTFLSQRFDLSVVETQEEIRLTLKNSSPSQ